MSLLLGLNPVSFVTAATDNATVVKTTAGQLGNSVHIANVSASPRYAKFYNLARIPLPATDVPVFVVSVQGTNSNTVDIPNGLAFSAGIAYVVVTGIAVTNDTATGAGDCVISFSYL